MRRGQGVTCRSCFEWRECIGAIVGVGLLVPSPVSQHAVARAMVWASRSSALPIAS